MNISSMRGIAVFLWVLAAHAPAEFIRPTHKGIEQWGTVPVFNCPLEAAAPRLGKPDYITGSGNDVKYSWFLGGGQFDTGVVDGSVSIDWYPEVAMARRQWDHISGQTFAHDVGVRRYVGLWRNTSAFVLLDDRTLLSMSLRTSRPNQWTRMEPDRFDEGRLSLAWNEAPTVELFRQMETWARAALASATGGGPIEIKFHRDASKRPFWMDIVATRDGKPVPGLEVIFSIKGDLLRAYSGFQGSFPSLFDTDTTDRSLHTATEPNGKPRLTDRNGRARLYMSILGPTELRRNNDVEQSHDRLYIGIGSFGKLIDEVLVKGGKAWLEATIECTVRIPRRPGAAAVETTKSEYAFFSHIARITRIKQISDAPRSEGPFTVLKRFDPRSRQQVDEKPAEVGMGLRPNDMIVISKHELVDIQFVHGVVGRIMPLSEVLKDRTAGVIIGQTPYLTGFHTGGEQFFNTMLDRGDWIFGAACTGVGLFIGSLSATPFGVWLGGKVGVVIGFGKKGYTEYKEACSRKYDMVIVKSSVYAEARPEGLDVLVFEGNATVDGDGIEGRPGASTGQMLRISRDDQVIGPHPLAQSVIPAERMALVEEFMEEIAEQKTATREEISSVGQPVAGETTPAGDTAVGNVVTPEPVVPRSTPPQQQVGTGVWMGAVLMEATPEISRDLDAQGRRGLVVLAVSAGGPAHRGGFIPEDLILYLDGDPVRTIEELRAVLRQTLVGARMHAQVVRNHEARMLPIVAVTRPEPAPPLAALGLGYLGASIRSVRELESTVLGLPGDRSVVVDVVLDGSPAARSGLRAGDLIAAAAGEPILSHLEFLQALSRRTPGDPFPLDVVRRGQRLRFEPRLSSPPEVAFGRETSVVEIRAWGLAVRELNTVTAHQLGCSRNLGLHVETVTPGGPAAAAGLTPGCVITLAEGYPAPTVGEFRALATGDHVRVSGVRERAGFIAILRR